jgi:hypothetical protein
VTTAWVAVALSYVVVVPLAFAGVVVAGPALGYEYRREHDRAVYAALSLAFALVLATAGPVDVPLAFDPLWLVGLPAGAALYAVDTRIWEAWTGATVEGGTEDVVWAAPMLAAVVPEEVVFRVALAPLVGLVGPAGYVSASAVAFGLAHVARGRREVLFKTGNGVAYALAYLATGSVVAPVLVHVGYNLVAVWVVSLMGTDVAGR